MACSEGLSTAAISHMSRRLYARYQAEKDLCCYHTQALKVIWLQRGLKQEIKRDEKMSITENRTKMTILAFTSDDK